MILNGGDLFHDNKPSRRTLVRAAPARSLPARPAPTPLS
jgi:DNA repair exonuclease SbcCD nuclease subunit